MALRQLYKRREITKIYWINSDDNPTDAFTKVSLNRALERLINSNKLTLLPIHAGVLPIQKEKTSSVGP
ncbi:hypothetical protein PTT_14952 [Pyrenophora teres f. teres 0-1]|uniref:Uncharacterized protein n=1 Tax=Pyrenophora teres f. teres (strain 0-1) TaxID=861557 RepID=E3RZ99_PYRTT|nr:hypothetical protein PTT_14952 [Pyrenophora teres f. teres 0-1]